jgi:hypothetical protein
MGWLYAVLRGGAAPEGGGESELFDWGGTERIPLEITHPHASFGANHRVRRAYTGLPYSIRIGAIGGVYPYLYELSNAPDGMAIGAFTGIITWPNPTSTATDVLARVTDTKGSTTTVTWTITVGTTNFLFLDAVSGNDTTGTGAIGAPWRTLSKLYSSSNNNHITYFRAGTYTLAGITTAATDTSNGEERIEWEDRSAMWLAYPGDAQPVIDYEYAGSGAPYDDGFSVTRLRLANCLLIYFDGLKFFRSMTMAFQVFADTANPGMTWRNCLFDTTGPGIEGGNSAGAIPRSSSTRCGSRSWRGATFTTPKPCVSSWR